MTKKKPGRQRDMKQYDLYQIQGTREIYIGRFVRDMIRDQYEINTKNLKQDIQAHRRLDGKDGEYRIYNAGDYKPSRQKKEPKRFGTMPVHVDKVKDSSGCRFGG